MSVSASKTRPSWLFATAASRAASSDLEAGGTHNQPYPHLELGSLQQQPCSQFHCASVILCPPMNAQAPAQDPVLPSSCLRRRISDSSSSCHDEQGDNSDAAGSDRQANYCTPSSNKAKRRRRLRVGFEPQIVQKVHPYPLDTSTDPNMINSMEEEGPPPASVLWYTHSELIAMKRVAKRTCARNRDLEYALNDAYQRPSPSMYGLPESAEISDDSEHETNGTTTAAPSTFASCSGSQSTASSTPDELVDDIRAIQQHLLSIPAFRELRGMERWSSQCHALSRGLTMLQVKTEVFVLQAQHATQSQSSSLPPSRWAATVASVNPDCLYLQHQREQELSDQRHALELARACAEASAPATRFARLMGQLDAVLARDETLSDDELQEEES
jgi:hypothetical protein